MNPSRLFILRPVATSLLMIGVLLVGIVAYRQLPVSALPEVDYPTIQVMTFYPGADPTVMASSVTAPLERQFGQVPGLSQIAFGGCDRDGPHFHGLVLFDYEDIIALRTTLQSRGRNDCGVLPRLQQ